MQGKTGPEAICNQFPTVIANHGPSLLCLLFLRSRNGCRHFWDPAKNLSWDMYLVEFHGICGDKEGKLVFVTDTT